MAVVPHVASDLRLYDSAQGQVVPLVLSEPGRIRLYVCGMTVYDRCHLGHGRMFVVFDAMVRWWRACGYHVTMVQNITDVDDKIIRRAADQGVAWQDLVEGCIQDLEDDVQALGVVPPDHHPRATDHIPGMVAMIERLVDRGHAYVSDHGDVLFDVSTYPSYGTVARKDLDALDVGRRVTVSEDKRSPLDFVLWKRCKPGEPSWPSPWGAGRPGWHIECSAMAHALCGPTVDVHGGGVDLKFPHHENERAQSECAHPEAVPFVRHWAHVGHVQVAQEKMSKSLGNFVTLRDLLDQHDALAIRWFLLASHYRKPLAYTPEAMHQAEQAVVRLRRACALEAAASDEEGASDDVGTWQQAFHAALCDDFNTPEALTVLHALIKAIGVAHREGKPVLAYQAMLINLCAMLGLDLNTPSKHRAPEGGGDAEVVQGLVDAREAARQRGDWDEADALRATLQARGVVVQDGPDGPSWTWG